MNAQCVFVCMDRCHQYTKSNEDYMNQAKLWITIGLKQFQITFQYSVYIIWSTGIFFVETVCVYTKFQWKHFETWRNCIISFSIVRCVHEHKHRVGWKQFQLGEIESHLMVSHRIYGRTHYTLTIKNLPGNFVIDLRKKLKVLVRRNITSQHFFAVGCLSEVSVSYFMIHTINKA